MLLVTMLVGAVLLGAVLAGAAGCAQVTSRATESGASGSGDPGASLSESCPPVPHRRFPATTPAQATGARVVDASAGISYLSPGGPWQPWTRRASFGRVGRIVETGYYLVTQSGPPVGEYYASVLSGRARAGVANGDPDVRCAAEHLADDLWATAGYPSPSRRLDRTGQASTVGGRPAYLVTFRLSYDVPGYDARGEQVAVYVVDTGRSELAVLYLSIPDTYRQYDPLVDQVVRSVQLT
ncbi:MAG TPA: hypothetical protein VLJ59_15110 [Mycobacteriales bacterium]|nr:hypothetical protein [Mycobacteriales bacterium]